MVYVILILVTFFFGCSSGTLSVGIPQRNNNFDILIFAQQWRPTFCKDWRNERSGTCLDKNVWTIHGIWPNNLRQPQHGPWNCNDSSILDVNELTRMRTKLEANWFHGTGDKSSNERFWKHEWIKHGTCATDALHTQKKYFHQGLAWGQQYNLTKLLKGAKIIAGQKYSLKEIHIAVKNKFKRNPVIYCREDEQIKKVFLYEIRICFNKKLQLIDCEIYNRNNVVTLDSGDKLITNCELDELVYIPRALPKESPQKPWPMPGMRPAIIGWHIPTQIPTQSPTQRPTQGPTQIPTQRPTQVPLYLTTPIPTQRPTQVPLYLTTPIPMQRPIQRPTQVPWYLTTPIPSKVSWDTPTSKPQKKSLFGWFKKITDWFS